MHRRRATGIPGTGTDLAASLAGVAWPCPGRSLSLPSLVPGISIAAIGGESR